MINQERILILSGELGDGHKQAANALLEASSLFRPNASVRVIDFMELASPRLHLISKYLYLQGIKAFPSVYGFLYRKTRHSNSLSQWLKMFNLHGVSRLLAMLNDFQPTVVVSTFPVAAAAMSMIKMTGMTNVPTVTVITDHTDHSYWLQAGTDRYIVGSDHVRQALRAQHIADERIIVTGIPVRSSFCRSYNAVRLREKYDLSLSLPTIMIMGGGYGLIGKGLIDMLASDVFDAPMQFIIVCGHNQKLQSQLEVALAHSKHHILLTGYTQHVHEFMACSDLIITKPGGLTSSEALSMELPMLLYRPLPGQEQDNAEFLLESGVAMQAKDDFEIYTHISRLFSQPQLLMSMRNNTRKIVMHNSARKALNAVLDAQYIVSASRSEFATNLATNA